MPYELPSKQEATDLNERLIQLLAVVKSLSATLKTDHEAKKEMTLLLDEAMKAMDNTDIIGAEEAIEKLEEFLKRY